MQKRGRSPTSKDGLRRPPTKGCANVRTLSGLDQNHPDQGQGKHDMENKQYRLH
jgi:hypothetical protein